MANSSLTFRLRARAREAADGWHLDFRVSLIDRDGEEDPEPIEGSDGPFETREAAIHRGPTLVEEIGEHVRDFAERAGARPGRSFVADMRKAASA